MVIAPLEDEIRHLRLRLQNQSRLDPGGRLTLGAWGRLPLLLVRTGVGAAAMVRTLSRALEHGNPGLCLLLGYGGGILRELRPGDLVIATDLIDFQQDRVFKVAPEMVARAARILGQTGLSGRLGSLVSVPQAALTPGDKAAAGPRPGALALDLGAPPSPGFAGPPPSPFWWCGPSWTRLTCPSRSRLAVPKPG